MASRLRPTLVTMGIALGGSLSGCLGQTSSDLDADEDDGHHESPRVGDGDDDGGDDDGGDDDDGDDDDGDDDDDEPMTVTPDDPILAAFCDVSWPPTKGTTPPDDVRCIDPLGECTNSIVPFRCYAFISEGTCDRDQGWMDPLYCVDGQWECPPGSTQGWECEDDVCENTCPCWGPLPEGQGCMLGNFGQAGAPGNQ